MPDARPGVKIAEELAGRKLLRYILPSQVGTFSGGSTQPCYTTPTAYSPEQTLTYLVLPNSIVPRTHVLLLDPTAISLIIGPIWVSDVGGIQYILPLGFPREAIVTPGAPEFQWEVVVD